MVGKERCPGACGARSRQNVAGSGGASVRQPRVGCATPAAWANVCRSRRRRVIGGATSRTERHCLQSCCEPLPVAVLPQCNARARPRAASQGRAAQRTRSCRIERLGGCGIALVEVYVNLKFPGTHPSAAYGVAGECGSDHRGTVGVTLGCCAQTASLPTQERTCSAFRGGLSSRPRLSGQPPCLPSSAARIAARRPRSTTPIISRTTATRSILLTVRRVPTVSLRDKTAPTRTAARAAARTRSALRWTRHIARPLGEIAPTRIAARAAARTPCA
jgi:hypothetical protein